MKKIGWLCLPSLLFFFHPLPAFAIAIGFSPASPTVQFGDVFNVDVVVSGLSAAKEIVSAYDLGVSYDPTILSASRVSFGPYLNDSGGTGLQDALFSSPGIINFAELSFLSDIGLAAQQLDSFVLATLSFDTLAIGSSTLSFLPSPGFGVDVKGVSAEVLRLQVGSNLITVIPSASVPEPTALALMLGAFVALHITHYRRHSKRTGFV